MFDGRPEDEAGNTVVADNHSVKVIDVYRDLPFVCATCMCVCVCVCCACQAFVLALSLMTTLHMIHPT